MNPALLTVGLVIVVACAAGLARRYGWSAPSVLVVVGVAISFTPGMPSFELDPDVVLIGFLPPLLYAAAIRTSLIDFRANRRAILLLSVGLVAFSTVVIGLVAWWVVPAVSLAAAFALGAVVAPPDAVAATAIARKVGMPRRIVSILEGESLVNDATALVALHTAIAAISMQISVGQVALDFLIAAGGGIVVGLVVAAVLAKIRKHITDPVLDTTLSFVAPYVAFLPAEAIHASGVLAVVVTGLLLGHKAPILQTAASRIAENTNWRTVQFLLENAVFLLIGLQLRSIVDGIDGLGFSFGEIAVYCLVVLLAVVLTRVVWLYVITALYRLVTGSAWSWPVATVISWAGMRGVVTLAAVFLIPPEAPQRDLLRLIAFVVVAGTLLVMGPTLPWLVRRLGMPGPDPAEDALQSAALVTDATRAGLAHLESIRTPEDPPEVIERLRNRADLRTNTMWERLGRSQDEVEPPAAAYRRLRMQMLDAEREAVLEARSSGNVDDEVLRGALYAIDLEESMLDRVEDAQSRLEADLVAPSRSSGDCEHLRSAPRVTSARTPGGCEECLRDGMTWVHLRLCLSCGHVGCCDSSIGKHASGHHAETGHPVMRSIEPGEAWRWCFVDEKLG
ncbi:sodium/proton antiporter (CPA1 family) [Herbihabitans rhizosphaerae]|uniref:Sodium/proton antiporter (CPA1 family) n=1 Tax=Herbihabitans rhizosphaerae TaxID=1872711 RepID=A0A4Q7KFF3_9PSEU|nr:Na+/H+ antiporter [Herbihabitans rhizosphaerae]RZS30391.1 sodium/proton antiporter (CPA1 family) [Herbihabitans rhizosphaerae]